METIWSARQCLFKVIAEVNQEPCKGAIQW